MGIAWSIYVTSVGWKLINQSTSKHITQEAPTSKR